MKETKKDINLMIQEWSKWNVQSQILRKEMHFNDEKILQIFHLIDEERKANEIKGR